MLSEAVSFIKSKIGDFEPEIGIVLGSGLGELADEFCDIALDYSDIPNFEASTISGHKGRLVFAEISGKKVVMMQGRFHYYEGHSIEKVVFPIKVMKKLFDLIVYFGRSFLVFTISYSISNNFSIFVI